MLEGIAQLCGGIGLFLLGMTLMTDSLKDMTDETLRLWLAKFTGSSFKAMLSGIGFTLAVQSSTATTLATIGFVSAGVLTFSQAIGIIIGANIGTTSTGWMIALLGVKFSITNIALPLIAFGALLKLLVHGRLALLGLCIAGFGLIFFGIDQLQVAMAGFADRVDLSVFGTAGFFSKLLLVLIGLVMTILLQSSSAAITATLAALATNVINLDQTLMLVIGQNIGTVATAILASIGATTSAKRTAAVHVIFNIVSAIFAFLILAPLLLWGYHSFSLESKLDNIFVVAIFHTAFSVLGALFFMPLLGKFENFICFIIPEKLEQKREYLDAASLSVPALAVATAEKVLLLTISEQLNIFKQALLTGEQISPQKLKEFDQLMFDLDQYLEKISLPDPLEDRLKLTFLLRIGVYVRVLREDLEHLDYVNLIRKQPEIEKIALQYVEILKTYLDVQNHVDLQKMNDFQTALFNLKQWTDENREITRRHIVVFASRQQLTAAQNLELLAAQRWLERLIAHSQRLAYVLMEQSEFNQKKLD